MKVNLPGFLSQWDWSHWAVMFLVIFFTSHQIYKRQVVRVNKAAFADVEIIEEDIKVYNTQAERLAQMEVLPPVKNQWRYVTAIADQYGVNVSLVSNKNSKDSYNGPLASWTADLKGSVGAVLVSAKEIQSAVPAFLYGINLREKNATIRFSVLGSE